MWSEFKAFLIKQNVLALGIAVVLGVALNTVVQAIVNDAIMPIVTVFTPKGSWQTALWDVGPFHFKPGDLASAVLNFLIIGFVCWRITKAFIKPAPAAPVPATKTCPYCRIQIDAAATRCPHCTSALEGVPALAMGGSGQAAAV
jgi:large conductance mechanosensitive channel